MKEEATCFFFPLELFSTFKTSWDGKKKPKNHKIRRHKLFPPAAYEWFTTLN